MVLLSCGCDVHANALTLCHDCHLKFKRDFGIRYTDRLDELKISDKKYTTKKELL